MITITPRNQLLIAIRFRAILREEQQRLVSPKGRANTWLLDLRRILTDAVLLDAAAEMFWDMMVDERPFQICGMEVAAIPLVSAILMKSVSRGRPLNGFIIRKERKTYGTGSLVEGKVTNDPIIVVDDLINSGSSLEKVRVILAEVGRAPDRVFVLVDYQSPPGVEWRARHGLSVIAPFSLADLGLSIERSPRRSERPILAEAWRFAPPDPNFFHRVPKSFPATDGCRVYAGSDCGLFWALNASTGAVEWTFKVDAPGHKNIWSSPALDAGRVYFGAYDGNVYCLDAASGAEIWRFGGADWVGSSPALAPELNLLFIGLEFAVDGQRGSIVALDMRTGEKVWETITRRYTHASPAYWPERRLVACGSNDDEVYLFDAETGKVRWRFQTSGGQGKASIRHAPAFDMARGQLVVACANGVIYIVDVENGDELWSVETANTLYTVPLVVGNLAFVGSTDKHLYVLDLDDRTVRRKINVGSKIMGPPKLIGDKVYFGAFSGLLFQIDPASLEITGRYQLPDSITNAPTFSEKTGCLYISTYVNAIFALKPVEAHPTLADISSDLGFNIYA